MSVHQRLPVQSNLYCRPVFAVRDMNAAILYYLAALDFQHDWSVPPEAESPVCAQVSRGTMQILLWTEPTIATPGRVYVSLEFEGELQALYEELVSKKAFVTSPPAPRLWGPQGFIVEDLDGNQLYFVSSPPLALPGA
jgi:uncharacterized glyoxalase superfamily protein PhnB